MLTRFKKKLGPTFRDARSRAGEMTGFTLTLKGVFQVSMKTVGGIIAASIASITVIFFVDKLKKNLEEPIERIPPPQSSSTQAIQHQLIQHDKCTAAAMKGIKYLDCSIMFCGQFSLHFMEMMIVAAALDWEFVDYDNLTHPKNFGMLFWTFFALINAKQSFLERKANYEYEEKSITVLPANLPMREKPNQVVPRNDVVSALSANSLMREQPLQSDTERLEVKVEQVLPPAVPMIRAI